MTTPITTPRRLYLMQVATLPVRSGGVPVPCYLVQTSDGKNILIDSGLSKDALLPPGMPQVEHGKDVVEQLAMIGVQPDDINMLICTHFDIDHAGNHSAFTNAELIVQRRHYELARDGYPRFAMTRPSWDHPALRYRLIDGDTELFPSLKLIETDGHTRGHQSVLIRLPETGPVLLAIDAVAVQEAFTPDRKKGPMDEGEEELVQASARKLIDVAQREQAKLVIFGHDGQQWQTLKKAPEYYG